MLAKYIGGREKGGWAVAVMLIVNGWCIDGGGELESMDFAS